MILFYAKREIKNANGDVLKQEGEIFATIDGRVHSETHLKAYITTGIALEDVGKYIIGWIDNGQGRIAYNLDKMELLQSFEDVTPVSPLDYKVDTETGELVSK
jgi:hypothetical protein